MPLSSQEIHFRINLMSFIQIWFVEWNWNSWIFQFICQSYIIKLNEKSQTRIFKLECEVITQCSDTKRVGHFGEIQFWMSFLLNTILNVISMKYHLLNTITECHFREIHFWMSFLLHTILNVISVKYNLLNTILNVISVK
jgi:hypothetical protein